MQPHVDFRKFLDVTLEQVRRNRLTMVGGPSSRLSAMAAARLVNARLLSSGPRAAACNEISGTLADRSWCRMGDTRCGALGPREANSSLRSRCRIEQRRPSQSP